MTLEERERKLREQLRRVQQQIRRDREHDIYQYLVRRFGTDDMDSVKAMIEGYIRAASDAQPAPMPQGQPAPDPVDGYGAIDEVEVIDI